MGWTTEEVMAVMNGEEPEKEVIGADEMVWFIPFTRALLVRMIDILKSSCSWTFSAAHQDKRLP